MSAIASSGRFFLLGFTVFLATSTSPVRAATPPLEPFDRTFDLYVLDSGCDCVLQITPAGVVSVFITEAQIDAATGGVSSLGDNKIAFAADGTMFFTNEDLLMRRTLDGTVSVFVSGAAFDAAAGTTTDVDGVAFGNDGMLYLCDDSSAFVYRVNPTTAAVEVVAAPSDFDALSGVSGTDLEEGIVGSENDIVYVAADSGSVANDDLIFAIDITDDSISVLTEDSAFNDPDVDMTRHPNGDLIVGDNSGADTIRRVTPAGVVSTFISEAALEAVSGGDVDLEGGLEFDENGDIFIGEEASDSILRFDVNGANGVVFVSEAAIQAVTGVGPDIDGGLAFSPVDLNPLVGVPAMRPLGYGLVVLVLLAIGWRAFGSTRAPGFSD